MTSRIFIVIASAWLILSAFAWPHTDAQVINTAATGAAMLCFALLTLVSGPARYLCLGAAAWLLVSTLRMDTLRAATLWNNGIVGVAIFFAAMVIGEPQEIRREKELYGRT